MPRRPAQASDGCVTVWAGATGSSTAGVYATRAHQKNRTSGQAARGTQDRYAAETISAHLRSTRQLQQTLSHPSSRHRVKAGSRRLTSPGLSHHRLW